MNFLSDLLNTVFIQLSSHPFNTFIALGALEVGFFTTPELLSEPQTDVVPVSTSSSFNRILRSDEDFIRKATLATGHSVKLGLMLGLWASVVTVTLTLIKG